MSPPAGHAGVHATTHEEQSAATSRRRAEVVELEFTGAPRFSGGPPRRAFVSRRATQMSRSVLRSRRNGAGWRPSTGCRPSGDSIGQPSEARHVEADCRGCAHSPGGSGPRPSGDWDHAGKREKHVRARRRTRNAPTPIAPSATSDRPDAGVAPIESARTAPPRHELELSSVTSGSLRPRGSGRLQAAEFRQARVCG